MFRPIYRYTSRLVAALLRAENAHGAVDVLSVPGVKAHELQEQAKNALRQAAEELDGSLHGAFDRALAQVMKRSTDCPDEATVRRLNGLLVGADESPYRGNSNLVLGGGQSDLVYVPPDSAEVPALMGELAEWLRLAWDRVPAVVMAGICQQQLTMIRPFEQCNEIVARLAGDLVLVRRGYALGGYAWPEMGFVRDKAAYEAATNSAHSGVYSSQADFTPWLEFYAETVGFAAGLAREACAAHASSKPEDAPLADAPVYLRDRQRRALEFMRENGAVRSGQYQEMVQVVPDTARRDFTDLIEKGLIVVRGVGRGTHYVLTARGAAEADKRRR